MSLMINDPAMASELLAARQARRADRHDEVWEGTYMMAPAPSNEHQELVSELAAIFRTIVDWQGLGRTLGGANVSDRREDWQHNYRVPDVVVFLNDTSAEDCGTHWFGGPDLAVEVVSAGDRTLEKLDFYAAIGTRELLIIDREPWRLTLYRRTKENKLAPVAITSRSQAATISPESVPIQLGINPDESAIVLTDPDGQLIRTFRIQGTRNRS